MAELGKRKRDNSPSSAVSDGTDDRSDTDSSSSSSDPSSSAEKMARKKKAKKSKKKHKKDKKKSKAKKPKKEKKKSKHSKKSKEAKDPEPPAITVEGMPASLGYEFGKHGIISDTDFWRKQEEFFSWLRDTRDVNPEQHGQMELKKLFVDYREDYNLGLLGEKYYDLRAWERKKAKEEYIAAKKASRKQAKHEHDAKHAAKEWARAAAEGPTVMENDEETRRKEFRRQREEYQQRQLQEERELRRLDHIAREHDAMIKSLAAPAK